MKRADSHKSSFKSKLPSIKFNKGMLTPTRLSIAFGVLAVVGVAAILATHAATFSQRFEAETGTPGGNAKLLQGVAGASGQQAYQFTAGSTGGTGGTGGGTTGARLDTNCGDTILTSSIGGSIQAVPAPASGGKTTTASGDPSSAISSASPGDVISVAPGTYGSLNISKSGSAGKCITVVGNGGMINFSSASVKGSYIRVINAQVNNSGSYGWILDNSNHVTLDNVVVNHSKNGGIQFAGASFILIDGCDVGYTNGGPGNGGEGESISVADGTTDSEVRYCKVHDGGEEGIDVKYSDDKNTNVTVHDNIVTHQGGPNIYIDGVNGVKVYNNQSTDSTKSDKAGIMLGCESEWAPTGPSKNIEIYGNTITGNAGWGIQIYNGGCGISTVNIHDNTVTGNGKGAIDTSQGTNITVGTNTTK